MVSNKTTSNSIFHHPNKRIRREIKTVNVMINMYCKKYHENIEGTCDQCNELIKYCIDKTQNCKFGINKTTCSSCPVHCYRKEEREKIKKIMRYSGPRMIIHHPYLAIIHMVDKYILNRTPIEKTS